MGITIDILLSELKYNYSIHLRNNKNVKFEWVRLFHIKDTCHRTESLQVCLLSEALEFPPKIGFYYLCLRDRIADSKETEESLAGMIIINENISLFELFNHAQEVFIKFSNWTSQMQESLVKNKGIQDLIDLSEPILKNDISVLDSSFKLIAHTKSVKCDDPIISELLHLGYHPEKMIEKLQKFRHIAHYKQSEEILIDNTFNISKYVALEKAFNYDNNFSTQVVMLCCQQEFSKSLLDLFEMLIYYVKVYFDRQYPNKDIYSLYASLIHDLIENGKLLKKESIIERAKYVNIPYKSSFNVFKIAFHDSENIPLDRIMQEVSERLITSKIIIYKQSIVAVNIYNETQNDTKNLCHEKISKLEDILNRHGAYCGISGFFRYLIQLQTAYKQADTAIVLGNKILETSSVFTPIKEIDPVIFSFEDLYVYYILDHCTEENTDMLEMDNCFMALSDLEHYDQNHNTDYMKILFTYLNHERSATQTAKQLYMHRNNVIYHINRIKELIGINLDDPEQKLKLLLAFKLIQFKSIKDTNRVKFDPHISKLLPAFSQ